MQEGVLPVEDPEQLLKELDECLNQLEKLIIVINKTNMAVVSDGELLSDLLAKRDVLKLRIASFQNTILDNRIQAANWTADLIEE